MTYATTRDDREALELKPAPDGTYVYDDLRPRFRPLATKALIASLVAGYALQVLVPGLTERFAVAAGPVIQGEWWRLVTGAFLHGGLLHLLANSWFGWIIGGRIERYVGPGRLLAITAAAMLGSSLLVVLGGSAAVGFSGVLYGWLAAWLAFHLTTRYRGLRLDRVQWRAYLQILGANLLLSLLPGISLLGHLGGFGAGFAMAYLLGLKRGAPAARY
jgi:membrane associated rhomboid family serine protease